jgi:hypothetical protein
VDWRPTHQRARGARATVLRPSGTAAASSSSPGARLGVGSQPGPQLHRAVTSRRSAARRCVLILDGDFGCRIASHCIPPNTHAAVRFACVRARDAGLFSCAAAACGGGQPAADQHSTKLVLHLQLTKLQRKPRRRLRATQRNATHSRRMEADAGDSVGVCPSGWKNRAATVNSAHAISGETGRWTFRSQDPPRRSCLHYPGRRVSCSSNKHYYPGRWTFAARCGVRSWR